MAGDPLTAGSGRQRLAAWKVVLAMVSLALSLWLWINGLLESLDRPSVGNDLERRQLELAVLAAPQLPPALRAPLVGENPEAALLEELTKQAAAPAPTKEADVPPERRDPLLVRALLLLRSSDPAAARPLLEQLQARRDPRLQPLVRRLLEDRSPPGGRSSAGLAFPADPLLQRLSCEVLGGRPSDCSVPAAERQAMLKLLGANLLPGLALLAGLGLLLREAWLLRQGKLAPPPALLGPDLGPVDAILLIAGGFVLIGELITPALLAPLLSGLLASLSIGSPVSEGLMVVGLYLGLMLGPLAVLSLQLRGRTGRPEGGWLQFRWWPVGSALRRALKFLLMVLPLVTLAGWLQQQIWGDPGGSNPLLDMVLRSDSPLTLALLAGTAIVLAPLFEETIFRGVLLPVVARQLGPFWGVVISSAVFGVAHLSFGELPPLFVLGLALGWLRLSSGRLSACVWLHGLWNALTFSNLLLLGT